MCSPCKDNILSEQTIKWKETGDRGSDYQLLLQRSGVLYKGMKMS